MGGSTGGKIINFNDSQFEMSLSLSELSVRNILEFDDTHLEPRYNIVNNSIVVATSAFIISKLTT